MLSDNYYDLQADIIEFFPEGKQCDEALSNLRALYKRINDLELQLIKEQDRSKSLDIQLQVWKGEITSV